MTDSNSDSHSSGRPAGNWLSRLLKLEPAEGPAVAWAWVYLLAVFSAYYVIRPIRDEAGVAGGVNNLSWLFSGTLIVMLAVNPAFAALVKKLTRTQFITIAYRFFALNLLVFLALFMVASGQANVWVGRAFFIWTSVFNLFVVSVFWAFMVDLFTTRQGKRLFGFIAAAATVGGILGSSVTATTAQSVGVPALLLFSAALLEVGVLAARRLGRIASAKSADLAGATNCDAKAEVPIGGGVMAGLTNALRSAYLLNICLYMFLYTVLSTFLYFQQAAIVDSTFASRGERTAFFARIDLYVNGLTLFAQIFLTSRVMQRAGVALTLTFVPALTVVGFLWLGIMPTAAVVVGFTMLRRAGNFAFARPTREVLFTVVSREDKYKTKNFIDTVVYRLGDQIGAWSSTLVTTAGLGAAGVAWAAIPLALVWAGNAWWLGQRQEREAGTTPATRPAPRASA